MAQEMFGAQLHRYRATVFPSIVSSNPDTLLRFPQFNSSRVLLSSALHLSYSSQISQSPSVLLGVLDGR